MKLCVSHSSKSDPTLSPENIIALSDPEMTFSHYSSWEEVPEAYWQLGQASGDYFLQKDYLQLLEDYLPGDIHFSYLLFSRRGVEVGMAYCQVLEFRADEHIRNQNTAAPYLQKWLAARAHLRVLVCGNMLLTGQHAYYFRPEETQISGQSVREALKITADHWRQQGIYVNALLLKDLEEDQAPVFQNWLESDFQPFQFQPNMILPIPAEWKSMDDYLEALNSKYRVRYRRAEKKLQGINRHELSAQQIRTYETAIYTLYREVADRSEFCMAYLPPNYFSELKARSPGSFRLWGYFKGEQLIGFCTSLQNGNDLEAHFIGLDKRQDIPHQLYLNMLYHLISAAIESRVGRLIFSRTAMAIKSSVGAIPAPTSVFLTHHTSKLVNSLAPYLVRLLEPKEPWEPRHPFREGEA